MQVADQRARLGTHTWAQNLDGFLRLFEPFLLTFPEIRRNTQTPGHRAEASKFHIQTSRNRKSLNLNLTFNHHRRVTAWVKPIASDIPPPSPFSRPPALSINLGTCLSLAVSVAEYCGKGSPVLPLPVRLTGIARTHGHLP